MVGSWEKNKISQAFPDWILIGFIVFMAALYVIIASRRFFDFDEFQVMYASAAILRGKAFYADGIESHFPLANLFLSLPIRVVGFNAAVLVISRYVILALNGIMLLYAYRISSLLWTRRTGLLVVSMTLSTVVFLQKGIEVRHDVFNTLFNVMGAYYGLTYLTRRNNLHLLISALCIGMAVASTQKALVISAGFVIGLIIYLKHEGDYKRLGKVALVYFFLIPIPLVVCLFILVGVCHDSLDAFLQHAVRNVIIGFAPHTDAAYPFPYNRLDFFKVLFVPNPVFYALSVSAIILILLSRQGRRSKRVIIGIWAAVGVVFYITSKRPFHQTFLPTVPLLAIAGGGLLSSMWDFCGKWGPIKRSIVCILCLFLLFALPCPYFLKMISRDKRFERALLNTSFCVGNLKKDDRVLCFTQNQIFFDPVLEMSSEECGKSIYDYDADCFERKMIATQCKVIINDHRTQQLSQEVKRRMIENYIRTKTGDILIPGFQIPPRGIINKTIWVKGTYYSPTLSLEIDGEKIDERMIFIEQGPHKFQNPTDRPVMLVYIFKPSNIKKYL